MDENRIGFDSKASKTLFRTNLKQVSKGDWVLDEFRMKISNLKTSIKLWTDLRKTKDG